MNLQVNSYTWDQPYWQAAPHAVVITFGSLALWRPVASLVFVPCEAVAGLSSSADSACVVGRGMTTMKNFFGVVLMKGDVKVAVIGYQLGCSECLL
jgi:hypothetical protein